MTALYKHVDYIPLSDTVNTTIHTTAWEDSRVKMLPMSLIRPPSEKPLVLGAWHWPSTDVSPEGQVEADTGTALCVAMRTIPTVHKNVTLVTAREHAIL